MSIRSQIGIKGRRHVCNGRRADSVADPKPELPSQVRAAKGAVEFEGEPSAYQGTLPGDDAPDDDPRRLTCARARPLQRETFRKRKLLQMHNLHVATAKAAKAADIRSVAGTTRQRPRVLQASKQAIVSRTCLANVGASGM